jgi:UDP-glucose 4-epimerase
MPEAYSVQPETVKPQRRKVLVTGAAGNIGSYFAEHSHDRYELRLMVHKMSPDAEKLRKFGEVVQGDLSNLAQLREICGQIDTVVHLAAVPNAAAGWPELLQNNIVGTYNLFVAARAAGCRRIVYASSIHAVSGYPADVQVKSNDPVNPGDLYGVTKCFGEALGRYMAEQEGISVICLRIGGFQPVEFARDEKNIGMLDAWVSRRDLNALMQLCVDNQDLRFAIFSGLSDNRFKRLDISDARQLLGYAPQDDLFRENPELLGLHLSDTVEHHNVQDEELQPSAVSKSINRLS